MVKAEREGAPEYQSVLGFSLGEQGGRSAWAGGEEEDESANICPARTRL